MRYRKGCRVEVLNKSDLPFISWRCGEILSGNGHTYKICYDYTPSPDAEPIVERVPRNSIRPPPPPPLLLQDSQPWVSGDIVEVFHYGSWKLAQLLQQVVGSGSGSGDQFRLTLLGSSTTELSANTSDLRARQIWNGDTDTWVMINTKPTNFYAERYSRIEKSIPGTSLHAADIEGGHHHRRRLIKKNHPPPPPMSEANAVTPLGGVVLGKRRRDASSIINSKSARLCQRELTLNIKREIDCDAKSTCSSVGSCSANYTPPQYSTPRPAEDADISDAESYCGARRRRRTPISSAEEAFCQGRIHSHSRELKEYRSSLSEFYASGPLDWEKEATLTNLRLALHISNDEHLLQLKRLMSSKHSSLGILS